MKRQLLVSVALFATMFTIQWQASAQNWTQAGDAITAGSRLGSTNGLPLKFITNNVERMRLDTFGRLSINYGSPIATLALVKKGSSLPGTIWAPTGTPMFTAFGESVGGNADFIVGMAGDPFNFRPTFMGRRAHGTLNAPTVVANGDQLASFAASGYDGSAFQLPATIDFFVDGTPSAGAVPTRISFVTGSNGATRAERLKVGSTGNIYFNSNQMYLLNSTGDLTLGVGNFNLLTSTQTIQFPAVPTTTNNPMINMFAAGTQNKDRMVIAHSPAYNNWGLQYQDSLDKFHFLSGGTPVLTADLGSWRVGVGNASPACRLDVAGTGSYDLSASEGDFRLGDATYRLKMGVANSGGGAGDAYIASSNRLYLGTSNVYGRTQTMSINNNGRVGIGTFTPAARLQVVGDTATTVPAIQATVSYVGSSDVRGVTAFSKPADGWGYGLEGTGGFIGAYCSALSGTYTGTGFGVYGTASGTAGTRIGVYGTASGGTVNNWGGYFPTKTYTSELRVGGEKGATGYVAAINGKLIATEVRVDAIASWPDYVFGSDYNLPSLEELERQISEQKHLPGVPSACEMNDNGIMLGAMQTKTMEKVEENTLYILQLNKKINDKDQKIEQLSNKIEQLEKKIEELAKMMK